MITAHADGGSRGNPGPAAYGFVVFSEDGKVLKEGRRCIGRYTNNVAEYRGLIAVLEAAIQMDDEVRVFLDSELIVKQMTGEYRVKSKNLLPLFRKARNLAGKFRKITFSHVYREHEGQKRADALVNEALDRK